MDEKQILKEVRTLFVKYGIKSVSMDNIAGHLGISKKTLYNFFSDKRELVYSVIKSHMEEIKTSFFDSKFENYNAIDVLLETSNIIIEKMGNVNPALSYDLKKYYPDVFKLLMEYKNHYILTNIEKNLRQGIAENLYRKEINVKIIAYFYLHRIDQLTSICAEDVKIENINTKDVLREVFTYHIRGIANENGIKYFEKETLKKFKTKN